MATKIKAHNLHTDVRAILDSKADISALAGKADSDTVVAALANKLTAADSDFTITHDGTNNIINSVGSGDLFIQDAGVNKLALNDTGIIVYGTIQSATSGTPTITSASNIIFNADSGNGIINFSGSKIINLGNPVDSQDAAPKSYVDSVNYKDSDVNTHLNTDSAIAGEVLSWNGTDYNWTAQSGGGVSGTTTVNTLYVDSDIKILEQGSILTRYPAVEFDDPYSPGTIRSYPERIYYEQKVDALGMSGILFGMLFQPFDIWSKPKTDVSSVDLTIHISTYPMPASGPDSDTLWSTTFSNSQIIQGHIIHDDDSDATFTITSNVCTTPNTNIAVIAATMAGGSNLRLTANLASPELTRIVVHSKFARKYDVTPYG